MTKGIDATHSIVVCEDDVPTLDLLCDHLDADRFGVLPARSAADALRLCRYNHPDLLLLDLTLPDAAGLDLLRDIREGDQADTRVDPDLPIIVMTGRDADERIRSLELDADDHVRKPFSYEQLRARITAVMRRSHDRHQGPITIGKLVIDPGRLKVTIGDRRVQLTKTEFTLLRLLASDPTRVFSRDELIRDLWGPAAGRGKSRALARHASALRRKLDADQGGFVVSCWGIGYRLIDG